MAERSFKKEVLKLRAGEGDIFRGEGILAVTKALLQSGVSYVGGYQGSPISHLMDVLNDAQDILSELGTSFEASGSEATAAAMLSASVNYPLRGAVTWKSTVGTNVASDALANLASSGVTGGAMVIIGEDYGEGSSIMQERTHAFAMKSQMWLIDPRPNMSSIVDSIEKSFQLSEASNTPLFFMMRIRSCHATGEFIAKDNKSPEFTPDKPVTPRRDIDKIILPPNVYQQEKDKIAERWPRAIEFIKQNKMNEFYSGTHSKLGIIMQGGLYNTAIRALQRLGLSDVFGETNIPLYVMNVTYPLVADELIEFCADKDHVLMLEEGQPEYIEHNVHAILRKANVACRLYGKDIMPSAGEYNGGVVIQGISDFLQRTELASEIPTIESLVQNLDKLSEESLLNHVPPRPAGLCTGCPERPLFSAIKQLQSEMGPFHISSDIGCHSFATLPPFNLGNTIMGYGLSLASSSSIRNTIPHKSISIMGDGGFWHNGLNSGVASAVFNKHDGLLIVINNGYSAATGGQDIPSLVQPNKNIAATIDAAQAKRTDQQSIEDACRGAGVKWLQTITTYDIGRMKDTLREALTTDEPGLKVIVAEGECMLNRQRRIKPIMKKAIADGQRTRRARFVIDSDTCTGDHACIRISGCPSLTIKENPDPLRQDPVSYVDNSCVGCGVCGDNVHSAVLCPSFSRVDLIHNPGLGDKLLNGVRRSYINWVQQRVEKKQRRMAL